MHMMCANDVVEVLHVTLVTVACTTQYNSRIPHKHHEFPYPCLGDVHGCMCAWTSSLHRVVGGGDCVTVQSTNTMHLGRQAQAEILVGLFSVLQD
jgi:hypothetical protein